MAQASTSATAAPQGWGTLYEHGIPYEDQCWKGSGLLKPVALEAGGPIIAAPSPSHREDWDHRSPRLRCTCWCGQTYVDVTQQDILEGRTGACARLECVAPR